MAMQKIDRPFELKGVCEVKKNDDGLEVGIFKGYGAVFKNVDSYRDIIMPGAFSDTLKVFGESKRKVPMLWQHRSGEPIGVYSDLKEDTHGLYVEGEINMEVQQGREAYSLMKQGSLTGLSIGYDVAIDEWDKTSLTRKLHKLNLWEISPVTFPANDKSRIEHVKSADTISDVERILRDAGFSRTESAALIAQMKQLVSLGEPSSVVDEVAKMLGNR
jgi:uncharacterized protein